jgi:hypothetical protein
MNRRHLLLATIVSLMAASSGHQLYAEEHNDPALIKLMGDAKITLQQGLTASAAQGSADIGQIRGRGRQASAVGLYCEGRQVLRGGGGPREREGRQDRARHGGR